MKMFLKIIFLLIVLAALAVVIVFSVYKDSLSEKARAGLASELSVLLRHPVNIGSVKYVPFQSISMDHVTVSAPEAPDTSIADVNNITFTVDTFSLLKNKQLKTTITVDGLHTGDALCNATIRTVSRKAVTYLEAFDLSMLDSVFIIEALAAKENFKLQNCFGVLELDNMAVTKGKIHFTHNDIEYLADFAAVAREEPGYDITLRSDNLGFRSTLLKEDNSVIVDTLTGMFYTLRFDLKGEIRDYLSPEAACSFNGTVETDLGTFAELPGKIGEFARRHPMSGPLRTNIYFKTKEPKLDKCEFSSTISGNNLRVENFHIKEILAKLSLKDGRLSAPRINGSLYGGAFICDLKMDLTEKDMPYLLSAAINNMDYGSFMLDVTQKETTVYGTLNAELSLRGYADAPETAEGSSSIKISDADLGPMPILTPLLGDIFTTVQNVLTSINKITIYEASADLEIKDRKISTDNLIFMGDEIYITSEGYVDFDGNLDFSFQNQFKKQPPDRDEEWQIALRNAIVRFGKLISTARLKGTIKDPKWEFEYLDPLKNLVGRNIKKFLGTFE